MTGMLAVTLAVLLSTVPPAETPATMLEKQAELIEAQDSTIALLEQKVLALEAAIDSHKRAELALQAESDALGKQVSYYRELWQAEMVSCQAERKRAVWAERFVAMKWGLAGAAAGVLAMEVAK